MGYMQFVKAAMKMESKISDVKEVQSKAASVEVTSTCNWAELIALTQKVAYLMLIVENKNKFSKRQRELEE